MVGVGEGKATNKFRIFGLDITHFLGNKGVCFAMEDQNGHLRLFHSLSGMGFLDFKTAVNPRSKLYSGSDQPDGNGHLLAHMKNDIHGRSIGTVGNDAFHIFRKVQFGSKEHRGTAHGDAI